MRLLSLTLCLIALVRITGLDLVLAQVDAWGSMMQRTSKISFVEALTETLSGERPCEKCLAIEEERQERKESASEKLWKLDKLQLAPPSNLANLTFFSQESRPVLGRIDRLSSQCYAQVEPPPPRI